MINGGLQMETWREKLVKALTKLGGEATLKDLYNEIGNTYSNLPKSYEAGIRDALERNSTDSEKYNGKYNTFYSVHGKGLGKWGLRDYQPEIKDMDFTQDDSSFSEGRILLKKHLQRERNHELIEKAKERFESIHGSLYCEVCNFDFSKVYGNLGDGFIEAHHTKPVSEMVEGEKTKIEDIVMVCSNCHSMIHRRKPWLNKEQISSIINTKSK